MIAQELKVPQSPAGLAPSIAASSPRFPSPSRSPSSRSCQQHEPRSMGGQPPVIWDRAEGIQVYDRWGNMWLDWSSGVLVTNAGHCPSEDPPGDPRSGQPRPDPQLLFSLGDSRRRPWKSWPTWPRQGLDKVFLLTTGARGVRVRHQARPDLGPAHGRRQEDHDRDASRTPSTAARWAPRWPAASRP